LNKKPYNTSYDSTDISSQGSSLDSNSFNVGNSVMIDLTLSESENDLPQQKSPPSIIPLRQDVSSTIKEIDKSDFEAKYDDLRLKQLKKPSNHIVKGFIKKRRGAYNGQRIKVGLQYQV